jgi:hypothetical protein
MTQEHELNGHQEKENSYRQHLTRLAPASLGRGMTHFFCLAFLLVFTLVAGFFFDETD